MCPFPTHFTQTIERMWNLTWEVWIFRHLFFTPVTAAVIAFEGSLIHLRRTLLSLSRKHDCYLTHVLFSSLLMSEKSLRQCLFEGRTLLWSLERSCGTADWFHRWPFISCLGCVVFLWRWICLSVCRGDIGVTVFSFFFFQRFKRWMPVLMKVAIKEAQVGRE